MSYFHADQHEKLDQKSNGKENPNCSENGRLEMELPDWIDDSKIEYPNNLFSSVDDLIRHNVEWIKKPIGLNRINGTHVSDPEEVDIDSVQRVPGLLVKMNELKFITTCSQCGVEEKDYSERAFVDGYLHIAEADMLSERLNRLGYLCMYRTIENALKSHEQNQIPVTFAMAAGMEVPDYVTHVGLNTALEVLKELAEPFALEFRRNWTFLVAVDPIHGRGCDSERGLFTTIVKILAE